jgi:hypothetical protein
MRRAARTRRRNRGVRHARRKRLRG